MTSTLKQATWMWLTVIACLSGLFYSSWPLGYLLNPSVASKGLASALEALHQPYNWLFISMDIICSLLILLVAAKLWNIRKYSLNQKLNSYIIICLIIFSLGTIIDTILPERCLPGSLSCPSWHVDHILLAHGLFSIISAFALFVILVIVWLKQRNWITNLLVVGYVLFGALSLYEAISPGSGNVSQHYYITLCGIWLALIPLTVRTAIYPKEPELESKKSKS